MMTSRLTSKAQTTIPQPVQAELDLRQGTEIADCIEAGHVVQTSAEPNNASDDPVGTFIEWHGPADVEAYADL